MSPALLLPAALTALTALALPLLIHIARRTEQVPTDFAALRWLRRKARPRRRPRIEEWPLLITRLLLLALLAFWLARPVLFDSADRSPRVAIVPGVDIDTARAEIGEDAHALWLAPGFPDLEPPSPPGPVPIASLLRQLDAELPADVALTVLAPQVLQGADAERPLLSRAVEWQVLPGAMPAPAARTEPAPVLTVRYANSRSDGVRYLRAAATAWQPDGKAADFEAAPTAQPVPTSARNLAWLSPEPLPEPVVAWVKEGGTVLLDQASPFSPPAPLGLLWQDEIGRPLVEGVVLGRGRVLRLARPFTPAAMPQLLEPDFPRALRALLAAPSPAPARVAANDYRPRTGAAPYPQPPRDLQPRLALLILLVLLVERWLATSRRRRAAP